jgi:hypothetical protein
VLSVEAVTVEAVTVGAIMVTVAAVTLGTVMVTAVVMVRAVTATVGTAAAVKFGLRRRRRAVTTAEVAAVGMTAMGMVAGKAIKPVGWVELFAKPVVFAKGN